MEINTIRDVPKESCTGCGACMNICPENCIAMVPDEEGFLRPFIHEKSCATCGVCYERCPVRHTSKTVQDSKEPECYAAWSKDDEIRFHSTSGGIFSELASYMITEKSAYVVGAAYGKDFCVEHCIIDSVKDIAKLRQSKYSQSDKGKVFKEIGTLLRSGEYVLFVGTPCENAGLRTFLGKPYDRLYYVDFICRGAISPEAFQKYLLEMKQRYNSDIKRVWFKNKENGWNRFRTRIDFESGAVYSENRYNDPYMRDYLKYNIHIRPCCGNCQFKGVTRPTDITLADFWGIKIDEPNVDIEQGVSLVLIQSPRGKELFRGIRDRIFAEKAHLGQAILHNGCAVESVHIHKNGKGES